MVSGTLSINKIVLAALICILGAGIVLATDYIDPVCKMNGTVDSSTNFTSFNHTIYYFCSAMCKDEFTANPGKFLNLTPEGFATDPVCKMSVNISTANETSTYNGTEYYFCKPMCKEEFDSDPDKFLNITVDNQ